MDYIRVVDVLQDPCLWIEDNLAAMRKLPDNTVDLVYLDPPFNTGRDFTAPVGSKAEGASFTDVWNRRDPVGEGELKDGCFRAWQVADLGGQVHSWEMCNYLVFMGLRLPEIRRVLKPTGSVFLHCDQFADSYLQLLLDAVFGKENQVSDITWKSPSWSRRGAKGFNRASDTILFYAKDTDGARFYPQFKPFEESDLKHTYNKVDEDGRRYYSRKVKGGGHKRIYIDTKQGKQVNALWCDIPFGSGSKERVGYPTQKPLKLLDRIIQATTDPDDLVLDPFAGCATTAISAQQLQRRWIGIDISPMAAYLVVQRMQGQANLQLDGAVNCNMSQEEIEDRTGKKFSDIERTL